MNVHTFQFKAAYWSWCSVLPGKRTHGLYWEIPFWENLITETANSSGLIFQLFSQSCSYGNPLISSIFLINFCFLPAVNPINNFYLLLCKMSWCSVLCRPFHVYNSVNPADCQKKGAIMLLKCFWPIYMQLYSAWKQSGVGKMRGKPWNVHVLKHLCDAIKKPSELASAFQPGTSLISPASVFQKSFEILYFRPILLGDIKFLLSTAQKKQKVRG